MKKKLFKTLFNNPDNSYPLVDHEIDNRKDDDYKKKQFSVALSYIFYKQINRVEPSNPKLEAFVKDLKKNLTGLEKFEQSTASRSDLLKSMKDGNYDYDFILLKEIENKISENKFTIDDIDSNENYHEMINLLKNKEIFYCDFVQNLKENIDSSKRSEEMDILYNLLEIDFDLIRDFIEENNLFKLSKKTNLSKKNLINESLLIPLQEDISVTELLNKKWESISIKGNESFYQTFSGNKKSDFENYQKKLTKNKLILKGKEGSGKSFLALYLSIGAFENYYTCKFIYADENTSIEKIKNEIEDFLENNQNEKTFIVIDSISNLAIDVKNDKQKLGKFRELLEYFSDTFWGKTDNYILLTINPNKSIYKSRLFEEYQGEFAEFSIEDLSTNYSWITTIMEKVIFEQYNTKITSNFNLYNYYIMKVIENNSLKLEISDLKKLLGKIAFNSFLGDPKINDFINSFNLKNKEIDFLRYNPICKTDEKNMGIIIFNHEIFKSILAGEYILGNPEKVTGIDNNTFRQDKWRVLFIYLSERLDGSNRDFFIKYPFILRGIIFHLGRQRNLEKAEQFLSYISDSQLDSNEKNYFMLEKSKKYYSGQGDYKKCLSTLSAINNPDFEPEFYYEYLIQLTSCTLDLFLPVTTIKLINNYLVKEDIINGDPRIYGNLSRAYLRIGDYENAEKFLMKKLSIHESFSLSDEMRDKVDLIHIKAFMFSQSREHHLYKQAVEIANQVLEYYNKSEIYEEISYSGKKIFVFRNLSYFLPYLSNTDELLKMISGIEEEKLKEKAPFGIIMLNIACYYFFNLELTKGLNCLNKAIPLLKTYELELSFAHYLSYSITDDINSKDKALEHYNIFYSNSSFAQNWIIENTDLDLKEKTAISFDDFKEKKLTLLNFSIF